MRCVLGFRPSTKCITLDSFGENNRGLAIRSHCLRVGSVDFIGVVTSPIKRHDIFVREMLYHLEKLRVSSEEVFSGVGPSPTGIVLIFAINHLIHPRLENAVLVCLQQRIPVPAPDHFDHVPTCASENTLELLDNFAIPTHRPIKALQVAVNDKNQIIEAFSSCLTDSTQRFRFIHLAIAEKCPDLAITVVQQTPIGQVFHQVSLVNRLYRPKPHRNRGKLPVVWHQPGMWIRRQTIAFNFVAKVVELRLLQPALDERPGIYAGG